MEFAGGLIVGVIGGFFLYPLFWSWVAWREYREASRRARRIDDVLTDMSLEPKQLEDSREDAVEQISRPRILRPIGR
jgi:hypothetical protein